MQNRKTLRRSIVACAIAAAAGCGGGGGGPGAGSGSSVPATPAPLSAPIVAGLLLPPAGSAYFGAYVDTSGLQHGSSPESVAQVETGLARRLAIDNGYLSFSSKFGTLSELDDYAKGRIPIYSWNCGPPNAAIAAGTYDASIRLQADSVRTYGWPVFVRYMWDPDLPSRVLGRSICYDPGTDNVNGTFSPAEYVAAWRHIKAIFAQEGAVNAVFVWTISSVGKDSLAYYPGDADVDWVGMDAYDLSGNTFAATYAASYAALAPFGKPIMIGETGAPGAIQPAFFSGAAATLQATFPLVRAYVYYDAIGQSQDWRVTAAAMPNFTSFAQSDYLAARYGAP